MYFYSFSIAGHGSARKPIMTRNAAIMAVDSKQFIKKNRII